MKRLQSYKREFETDGYAAIQAHVAYNKRVMLIELEKYPRSEILRNFAASSYVHEQMKTNDDNVIEGTDGLL